MTGRSLESRVERLEREQGAPLVSFTILNAGEHAENAEKLLAHGKAERQRGISILIDLRTPEERREQ